MMDRLIWMLPGWVHTILRWLTGKRQVAWYAGDFSIPIRFTWADDEEYKVLCARPKDKPNEQDTRQVEG